MERFVNRHRTMGRYKCVTLQHNNEDVLAGELGDIWISSPTLYRAFKIDSRGNEKLFTFEIKDLDKWVLKLKVPMDIDRQVYLANNPNSRHDVVEQLKKGKS